MESTSISDLEILPSRGPESSCVQLPLGIYETSGDDEFLVVLESRRAAPAAHSIIHGPGIPGSLWLITVVIVVVMVATGGGGGGRRRGNQGVDLDAETVGAHDFVCSLGRGGGGGLVALIVVVGIL